MRLYIYLNKELIKSIAPKLSNLNFDVDFFEYSEKQAYTTNNNTYIRPEIENNTKKECNKIESFDKARLGVSGEKGILCNFEIEKRYINIDDVSNIKNNKFYYEILEKIPFDNRLKKNVGRIKELENNSFYIGSNKYLIDDRIYKDLIELFENSCEVNVIGYKINCLNETYDVFKVVCIYIE